MTRRVLHFVVEGKKTLTCGLSIAALGFITSMFILIGTSIADEVHEHTHKEELHFSHPLIAESPSPDTKIRLDYQYRDVDSGGEKEKENLIRLEGEYAFHKTISLEFDISYLFLDPEGEKSESALEEFEIGLKLANFAFAQHHILLGYGIEFGIPVGDEEKGIGSSHIFEYEPFFSFGYMRDELEIVAFTSFGIPTNQREGEEIETEFGFNLSLLYHVTPTIEGLLELDGESVLSGEERGKSVVNITPGIKVKPFSDRDFKAGLGVSFPVSDKEDFDIQVIASLFYHL